MIALMSEEKQRAALHYELLFENGKVWYTSKEAAKLLGMSVQFVRDAFQSQELMGQEITSRSGPAGRRMKLIHRDCLLLYLMQTANYSPNDFLDKFKRLLLRRPPAEQQEMRAWLESLFRIGKRRSA